MKKAIAVVWQSIGDVYNSMFFMIGLNIIWFLLTLIMMVIFSPFMLLMSAFGLSYESILLIMFALLAVVPNPASAGLHHYANRVAEDELADFSHFRDGLKQFWAKSFLLSLIAVGVTVLTLINASFYVRSTSPVLNVIGIFFFYAVYVWISLCVYMQPLLVKQESKKIRHIFRNSALFAFDNPLFTLTLILSLAVMMVLSFVLPIFLVLLTGALFTVIQNRAVLTLLAKYTKSST